MLCPPAPFWERPKEGANPGGPPQKQKRPDRDPDFIGTRVGALKNRQG
jgi:hypothetical protein